MYEKARVLYEKPMSLVRKIKTLVRLCPNRTRGPFCRLKVDTCYQSFLFDLIKLFYYLYPYLVRSDVGF